MRPSQYQSSRYTAELDNGSASFVGLERVVGRSGSFVLQATGSFEAGTVNATWFVVSGSGTRDLRGLRGQGGLVYQHGQHSSVTLDYDFE